MKNARSKKIAFLDRDGVINKSAPTHQYITRVEDFIFNPGIFTTLKTLARDGFSFIVVTNQRGVAKEELSLESLSEIHTYMVDELAKKGIAILDVFFCPHEEVSCDCRKPNDGMLRQAAKKYLIDKDKSIMVGDSESDIEAGRKFGLSECFLIKQDDPESLFDQYQPKKIRVAFVKYGGLTTGGTEKMLQIIAANLDKRRFSVDYYYCDSSPFIGSDYHYPSTDPYRLAYMREHGVNLIKFDVGSVNMVHPYQTWIDTNFWEKFNEDKYDLVQTGRAGHPEYPFTKMRHVPILEIVALNAGADSQYNLARSLHICQWSADQWIASGGDKKRVEIISLPIEIQSKNYSDYRLELGLSEKFIYGMHQRAADNIFSQIPLFSYKKIESDNTWFIIMGGSSLYKEQAKSLGIKNITFLPETGNSETIFQFLSTLNVYAHGRKDGEINSQAIAESMYFALPIVSHRSHVNNGHVECIGDAGLVVEESDVEAYAAELKKLQDDKKYYNLRSQAAKKRFIQNYELSGQMKKIEGIYESVVENPYPHPMRRVLYSLHWTQNIRIILKWIYRCIRFTRGKKI